MEFYKNLYPQAAKKKFQLIMGIVVIVLAILWILTKIYLDESVHFIDWLYSGMFFIHGVIIIMHYFGYPIEELFGKRFISVTTSEIQYKPKTLKPEIKILWKDVDSIFFKVNNIEIKSQNGEKINLQYNYMDYASVQELKDTVKQIAQDKSCTVTI